MSSSTISRDGNSEASTSSSSSSISSSTSPSKRKKPEPQPLPFKIPKKFHSMTAGAGAGLVSSIVTCPLDVVKTRLQAQHLSRDSAEYEGVRKTVNRIWRQAGFRGFYRGLGPTLGGYLPTWGIYFTVYDLVKDRLAGIAKESAHPQAEMAVFHVLAAMTAGATGTIVTNPLWVVKTRFMAQAVLPPSASRYRNTLDAITSIYRTEGFRAFYKGLIPSLIGVSHVAVQFPLYEKAKVWADSGGDGDGDGDHSTLTPSTILACSAFSKMVASLITYPHEVLRTRLQIQKSNAPSSPSTSSSSSPSSTTAHTSSTFTSNSHASVLPALPRVLPPPLYSPLVTGSNPPTPYLALAPPEELHRIGPAPSETQTSSRWGKKGGVVDTFMKIRRQDGWRGFYRGLSINLVRTVPNSAVTMLSYELIMRRLSV